MTTRNILILYTSIALLTTLNLSLSIPTRLIGNLKTTINEMEVIDSRSNYAAQMISFMNLSINPCNDFYEYACGNWKNVIKERMTTKKRSNILDIVYKLDDIVGNILQRHHIDDVAPEYVAEFELAKKFYNKCLKAKLHPMQVSLEYLAVLKEIGGFPAVDEDWNCKNFHWLNMSAHLSNFGISSFVKEVIISQYPFPPYFKMPDFGFDILLNHDTINNSSSNAYKTNEKSMREILVIYGVRDKNIYSIITETFDFLKEILQFIKLFHEDADKCALLSNTMNKTDIKEKWRIYNEIAWLGKPFGSVIKEYEDCCTPCTFLYEKIDKLCEKNKRAAANYLSLKFLFHMDARLKEKKFQKDFCISNIKESMKYFFDHLYMKVYFSDDLRKEISYVIKEIRESLHTIIKEGTWLDETTRKAALLKESTIVEHIGRYENTNFTKLLIGELKKLKFVNGSWEANMLNLRKFEQYMKRFNGLNYEKLSYKAKPLELFVGMQVNSFYDNMDNSINLMAGILMVPVYNKAWPYSLKFGTLGHLIGHEFTHGFDTMGAKYDENGDYKYWWSIESEKAFKQRTNCYVDHYQKYLIPEINRHVNGKLTKNENIADGGGLREALMAYRRYTKNVTKGSMSALKEEKMPGIDLLPEQLFFLGFAQLWCSSYSEADYWEEITSSHVINKYRVLGALSNNADFAKVYNCSVGSKMNPTVAKCEAW